MESKVLRKFKKGGQDKGMISHVKKDDICGFINGMEPAFASVACHERAPHLRGEGG